MGKLIRRIHYWLRRRERDDALREELDFHRSMTEQALAREGAEADRARFEARRRMGNATLQRENARAVWISTWLESVAQDVTYAVGSLRRQPGFAAVAIVTLGVAIGLNTSVFTVLAGLTLRPMAGIADPDRVVTVSAPSPAGGAGLVGMSFPEFRALASGARTFSGLAAARAVSVRLDSQGVARSTAAYFVTPNYFDVLGVRMAHGRAFAGFDDPLGPPQFSVVLGHALWQSRFGGDPSIAGGTVFIDGMPFTVAGIASPSFVGSDGSASRVWLPLSTMPLLRPRDPFLANMLNRPEDCCVNVVGRLTPAATREQAAAEIQALSNGFRAGSGQASRPLLLGGTQFLSGRRGATEVLAVLAITFTAMVLVLTLACANVGNLLLARAAGRLSELGVRLSLGAGRARIVRQLLTEGIVLAGAAAGAGSILSAWGTPLALAALSGETTPPFDVSPDRLVLAYSVAIAVAACLGFALAPALHATRIDVARALKDGTTVLRSRFPLRSVLLAVQVAVAVVLLTSAGLLLRGAARASVLDPGFQVDGISVARVDLPETEFGGARTLAFAADLEAALRDAAIGSFALSAAEPLGEGSYMTGMRLTTEGEERTRPVEFLGVSPGYFELLGIPLVAGREFTREDAGRPVVIVNQALARREWPGVDPVGRSFVAGGRTTVEVVGVARDAYTGGLDSIDPMYFQPLGAVVPTVLFETSRASVGALVAATIERLEPRARVEVFPLRDRLDARLADLRTVPLAASAIGLFALALSAVGMSGVFAFVVRQRTREIGIRMALGARPGGVVRLVLAGNSRALGAGLAVGLLGALASSQVLRGSLYGLSPLDPAALGGVALVLAVAALAATWVPVRRAVRVDPMQALRCE